MFRRAKITKNKEWERGISSLPSLSLRTSNGSQSKIRYDRPNHNHTSELGFKDPQKVLCERKLRIGNSMEEYHTSDHNTSNGKDDECHSKQCKNDILDLVSFHSSLTVYPSLWEYSQRTWIQFPSGLQDHPSQPISIS